MTHTPRGTVMDDPMGVGETMNLTRSYTGTAFSMYSHTGTHIDALNHFGIHGKIWNGFEADKHLGDRGWNVTGIEKFPPLIARGVLIDVAAAKGVDMLPDSYRVTRQDLKDALARQKVKLQQGDVVLIRTGRMRLFEQPRAYMANPPGMGTDAARFLVEDGGAMIVGADNLSFETFLRGVRRLRAAAPTCWHSRVRRSSSWWRWTNWPATRSTNSPSSAAR